MVTNDYSEITELPGSGATQEQIARLQNRYHMAKQYAIQKRSLEVACGAGLGLEYVASGAKSVVGGDYTHNLLRNAQKGNGGFPLVRLDAHYLPFLAGSFDFVYIFEAIYYLENVETFFSDIKRLLDKDGTLLIGSVNKNWSEFAPSPFSTRYFSPPELQLLLEQHGFTDLEFFGAFPTQSDSLKSRVVSIIRKLIVALNLMPKTLEGRARIKKWFYGGLTPLPCKLENSISNPVPVVPIKGDTITEDYKIIYCIAYSK